MANDAVLDLKQRFEAFAALSSLEVHLLRAADGVRALQDGLPEDPASAPSRRNFFFDEQTAVTLILKSAANEAAVHALLPDLEIVLSAYATDAIPVGDGNAASASGKNDLTAQTLSAAEPQLVLAVDEGTSVTWNFDLHVPRPQVRLQRPAVYFTAALTLSSASVMDSQRAKTHVMPSFEPLPANVLEPLRHDPTLGRADVHLSQTRVTKVAPASSNLREDIRPVRGTSKRAFPFLPALFTRMRYFTFPDTIVASLHIETSQIGLRSVIINDVHMHVADAQVTDLSRIGVPKRTSGGDETVFLQSIQLAKSAPIDSSIVDVVITATAVTDDDGDVPLVIGWQTPIKPRQPAPQTDYSWIRPAATVVNQTSTSLQGATENVMTSVAIDENLDKRRSNIVFTFTASRTVPIGSEFGVIVQCNNRSTRARRFALITTQLKRSSAVPSTAAAIDPELPMGKLCAPSVLDLNPDVRIGPLPAGTCYETHLKFRAIGYGPLDLGTVRIVDLESRQTVDVRQLPDVIAVEE